MLSQEVFKQGLKELEECFDNFNISEGKLKAWYKHSNSKNMDDSMWQKKIANCIKGCRKIPTLADILDIKGYYSDNTKTYDTPTDLGVDDDYDYSKSKCPAGLKDKMKSIGMRMPVR